MSLDSALGKKLYHARKARGLTQEQVAEAVGITPRWYQKIEKGAGRPSTTVAFRLLSLLNVDIREIGEVVGLK